MAHCRQQTVFNLRGLISLVISGQLILAPLAAYSQVASLPRSSSGMASQTPPKSPLSVFGNTSLTDDSSGIDKKQLAQHVQTAYWGALDQEMPLLTEFALGEPIVPKGSFWRLDNDNPLVDKDPFFMRSQEWTSVTRTESIEPMRAFFEKDAAGDLHLGLGGESKQLHLKQKFTPLLETPEYILLSADSLELFKNKNPNERSPGEGVFFITKKDFAFASQNETSVPVFFFALPGEGWTNLKHSFEWVMTDQIVLYDQANEGLPIDRSDFTAMEEVGRKNLILAQTWTVLEGQGMDRSTVLPRPYTTAAFGLFLSGQLPEIGKYRTNAQVPTSRSGQFVTNNKGRAGRLLDTISNALLPKATASEDDSGTKGTRLSWLRGLFKSLGGKTEGEPVPTLEEALTANPSPTNGADKGGNNNGEVNGPSSRKLWLTNAILYGGTGAAAVALAPQIDWQGFLTVDLSERVMIVTGMMASVAAASLYMKLTVYREKFKQKYPYVEGKDSIFKKEANAGKAFLDVFSHSQWFSLSIIPQGIRHALEYFKDRFIHDNKLVGKVWDFTMGFQMRQNEQLAMNYKTFWLGAIVLGMTDSLLVAVDLLIFYPYLLQHFGIEIAAGGAAAAFVTAEILRNFLSYLQAGAHSYSADVKMINLESVEKLVRRQMTEEGLNPNSPQNQISLRDRTNTVMESRFKNVGLPDKSQFLFDPLSFMRNAISKMGYSLPQAHEYEAYEGGGAQAREELKKFEYTLQDRHWGLVRPAVNRALRVAKRLNEDNPSQVGKQTVDALTLASHSLSKIKARAFAPIKAVTSRQGFVEFTTTIGEQIKSAQLENGLAVTKPFRYLGAVLAGAYQALAINSTRNVVTARSVVYAMSATSAKGLERNLELLPKSWIEMAGSREAALAMARLIHRAFFATYDQKPETLEFDSELERQFGVRAEIALETGRDLVGDPFLYNIYREEKIHELHQAAVDDAEIQSYTPPKKSFYERMQWERALRKAESAKSDNGSTDDASGRKLSLTEAFLYGGGAATMALAPQFDWQGFLTADLSEQLMTMASMAGGVATASLLLKLTVDKMKSKKTSPSEKEANASRAILTANSPGDTSSDKLWADLSERYQKTHDIQLDPTAQDKWVEDAKVRTPVAQAMGGRVGLHIEDPDKSPFVQEVIIQATLRTERSLVLPNEAAYMKTLTETERTLHEAKVFTGHFMDIYVENSVHSHDHMRSDSPEYPGRLQFVRRALVGKPGEKFFSGVVRVAEAFFRNEETSYKPGVLSALDRSIPLIPDAFRNSFRTARVLPYALLFGYPVAYYVWQIHMPFILYAILVASGFAHMTIVEFNNRIMKNFNIKPMNDVASKLVYSWIHSRGTNAVLGAMQANADRAVEVYDNHVVQPVERAIDSSVIQPAKELIGRCRRALGSSAEKP